MDQGQNFNRGDSRSLSPPALFSSCPPSFSDFVLCLFLPLSLSLSVLLTNWAIAFWEMSHHPAARCSLSTRAYTHTSEYLQSSVTPFLSFSVSSPAVLSSLTLCFSFVWYWCFLMARIRPCTVCVCVCVFVCVCVPALLCFHASLHAILTHLFCFAFFNECRQCVTDLWTLTSCPGCVFDHLAGMSTHYSKTCMWRCSV